MEELLIRLTLGLIFLSPLFFLPFTHEYFESPKSYLLTAGGLTLFFLALATFSDFSTYLRKLANNTLWQLLVGFLLVQTITSYFGVDFISSLFGSQNQKNGLVMLFALTLFASVISYLIHAKKLGEEKIYQTLLYSAVTVSVLGIAKYLLSNLGFINVEGLLFDNREVSTFGQPNFFGFFVALSVLFVPYATTSKKKFLFFAILLIAEILTVSKSGWIIFGINTIVLLIKDKNYNLSKKYIGYFAIAFLVLINIGLVFTKTKNYQKFINSESSYQYRRFTTAYTDPTTAEEDRIFIYKLSMESVKGRLLLGYGKGNIDSALFELVQNTKLKEKGVVDSSHNLFLDTTLEGGIFSLLLLIGIFSLLFIQAIKTHDYTKTFMQVTIMLNGLIHNTSNIVYLMIFLLIGMYLVVVQES